MQEKEGLHAPVSDFYQRPLLSDLRFPQRRGSQRRQDADVQCDIEEPHRLGSGQGEFEPMVGLTGRPGHGHLAMAPSSDSMQRSVTCEGCLFCRSVIFKRLDS